MKKLFSGIRNMKLLVKLILIIVIDSFVLLLIEIAGRKSVYEAYDKQLYLKTTQVCIAYVNELETEISKIENLTFSIIGDNVMQDKLVSVNGPGEAEAYVLKNEIKQLLNSYGNTLNDTAELVILLPDGTMTGTGISAKEREILKECVPVAQSKKGKTTIYTQSGKVGVFRQIRKISGLTMDNLGVLFVQVDLDDLMKKLEASYEKIDMLPEVFIFENDTCIYTSSQSPEPLPVLEDAALVGDRYIVPCNSSKLGWVLYISIPYGDINESIRQADLRATLFCIMIAVVVCLISAGLVYSLTPHINYLIKKFELFATGEMPRAEDYPSYEGRTDEFGRLHNQFDKMAQEHMRLTQESYQNMLLLKETQFQQLQQQIRPHFLFNTLSTIVWTATENNDMETAKMANALGRILRSSFRNTGKLITVREETEVVRDYLYIQKMRYAEKLQVMEELEEDIMDAGIPPFTIQPVIENVIVHVVEKSLEPCQIKILGRKCHDLVEITVEDSGRTLDERILEKLESGEVQSRGNGVGLNSVNARIRLVFSSEYGITISREEGCSRVRICIPYVKMKEE